MLRIVVKLMVLAVVMTTSQVLAYGQVEMDEFRVPRGTKVVLGPELHDIIVKRLVLEDESTVEFSASLCENDLPCSWTVFAEKAIIGANTRIIGTGVNGRNGPHGERGRDGDRCNNGANAPRSGGHGTDGANGVSVILTLGIADLGSLYIESHGGDGGNGGDGARGGNGGRGSCGLNCRGGNGGRGSDGGSGANGGNGGDIVVEYWSLGNIRVAIGPSRGLWGSSFGGKEGHAGMRGNGGAGGGGSGNCGVWPYWRRGGGSGGVAGSVLDNGIPGVDGVLEFSAVSPKNPPR